MNRLESWWLRHLLKKLTRQSPRHKANVVEVFTLARAALRHEFPEDSDATLDCFMQDALGLALRHRTNLQAEDSRD